MSEVERKSDEIAFNEEITAVARQLPKEINRRKQKGNDINHGNFLSKVLEGIGGEDKYAQYVGEEIARIHKNGDHGSVQKARLEWGKALISNMAVAQKFEEERRIRLEDMTKEQIQEEVLPVCKQLIMQMPHLLIDVAKALLKSNADFRNGIMLDPSLVKDACGVLFEKDEQFRYDVKDMLIKTLEAEATRIEGSGEE